MPIRATCSSCGKVVKAGDDWAGKSAKCPGCQAKIEFAAKSPPPAPENFDDVIAEEQRVAKIMGDVEQPSPPPMREPQAPTVVVRRGSSGVQQVTVTSIKLTIGNMMELIIGFWIATFLAVVLLGIVGAILMAMIGASVL